VLHGYASPRSIDQVFGLNQFDRASVMVDFKLRLCQVNLSSVAGTVNIASILGTDTVLVTGTVTMLYASFRAYWVMDYGQGLGDSERVTHLLLLICLIEYRNF
jgi:hypothetical protein